MTETKPSRSLSRRSFFKITTATLLGTLAAFYDAPPTVTPSPTRPGRPQSPPPNPEKKSLQLPLAPLKGETKEEEPKPGRVINTNLGDWDPIIDESLCKNHDVKERINKDWKNGRRVFAIVLKRRVGGNETEIDLLPLSNDLPEQQKDHDLKIYYALADKTGENLVSFDPESKFKKIESLSLEGEPTGKPPPEFSNRNFTLISVRLFNPNGKQNQPPQPPYYRLWVPKLAERKDAVLEEIKKAYPSSPSAQFILSPETPIDLIWVITRVIENERIIITPQGKKEFKKEYFYALPFPDA